MPEENDKPEVTEDATGADKPKSGEDKKTSDNLTDEQRRIIDDHVDSFIGQRLERERNKWQADQDAKRQQEKDAAEQDRLKEQEKWRELAEGHEAKVNEIAPQLEAVSKTLSEYQAAMDKFLSSRLETLGDKAKTAVDNLPGEPDALNKLQWLEANEELFKSEAAPSHGTPPKKGARVANSWNQNRQQPAPQEQTDNYTVRL